MKEFDQLNEILERLIGPDGCPWDQKQTLMSAREMLLEETCETIDAINAQDNAMITEELGDLLFLVIFCCKLAEKERCTTLCEVLEEVIAKLIRRHPHVFGNKKIDSEEVVISQWEEIKRQEKASAVWKSRLDSIPHSLPALARALEILKKMKKADYPLSIDDSPNLEEEQILGNDLIKLVMKAQKSNLDPEMALRNTLVLYEKQFKNWEGEN